MVILQQTTQKKSQNEQLYLFGFSFSWLTTDQHLTRTLVELAGLCDVPFAKHGPLSNRWPGSIDIVTGQDGV